MKKLVAIACVALTLTACGGSLSIADAEKAGFHKSSSKFAGMIGAKEGWGGTWKGETVELYEFKPGDETDSGLKQLGGGFWADECQNQNLLMVSTGKKACEALESL